MRHMSFSETIFLFVLALIIFGPKKLPEIARQIGKYMNEFKRASNEFKAQIEQEIAHLEVEKPAILPPSAAPEGTASRSLVATSVEADSTEKLPATPLAAALAASESASASDDEPLFATNSSATPAPQSVEPTESVSITKTDAVTTPSSPETHA